MKRKRLSLLVAAVFMVVLVLSACGGTGTATQTTATTASTQGTTAQVSETQKAAPVQIEFSGDTTAFTSELYLNLFDGFAKAFPNITVKKDVRAKNYEVIAARVASGDIPDIIYGGLPNGYDMIKQGKIYDFNEMFDSKAFDADCTVKESLTAGSDEADVVDGKKYLVPIGPGITGLVYNVKMFTDNGWKVPASWEDLLAVSEQIKAKGITPIGYGALGGENRLESSGFISSAMYQFGGDQLLLDLDNLKPGAWSSQPVIDSLNMLKEMVDKGIIDKKGLGMDPPQSQVAFLQGKYAMVISGFWFEMEMKDQMKDMQLGFIPFPANKGGNVKQALNSWFNGLVAWKGDPAKKEAVYDFMKYILSYEFQKKLATNGGLTLVSNKRVMEEMSQDPNVSYFTKAVAQCIANPNAKEVQQKYQFWYAPDMRTPFIGLISDVVSGKTTPEQAAAKMEENAQKLANNSAVVKRTR